MPMTSAGRATNLHHHQQGQGGHNKLHLCQSRYRILLVVSRCVRVTYICPTTSEKWDMA